MAHVKWYFRHSAARVLGYIMRHGGPGDEVSAHGCVPETAIDDFASTRTAHRSKGDTQVIHVMQSWSAEDSQRLTPKEFHEIGRQLAERYFPGHEFVIKTHTDKAHLHNHIAINAVNYETGRKFENKHVKWKLQELRRMSDGLCKERGLSVMDEDALMRRARAPERVQALRRFSRESYILDTVQKANFARQYATGYADYVGILGELGVPVRVEKENITYFYPGRSRGKRGDKLGAAYDKAGLEATFKANHEKVLRQPEIRDALGLDLAVRGLKAKKDFSTFENVPRRESRYSRVTEHEALASILPATEVARARRGNILDYCRHKGIAFFTDNDGNTRLNGRTHVVLTEFEWKNTKNHTTGSLIDFVAAHKNLTLLQAVADINYNPRLLLLEKHLGTAKRIFTSFYVPAAEQAPMQEALHHLSRLLESRGGKRDAADSLLKAQQAQVDRGGVIRLFPKNGMSGGIEYTPSDSGGWTEKRFGEVHAPFHQANTGNHSAAVFLDPLMYAAKRGHDVLSDRRGPSGLLVLMEPNDHHVDRFLAENPHISRLDVVLPEKPSHVELDFFNNLKSRSQSLGIEIDIGSPERALSRGRGMGISF